MRVWQSEDALKFRSWIVAGILPDFCDRTFEIAASQLPQVDLQSLPRFGLGSLATLTLKHCCQA
jgi:hypothetical protein